MIVMQNNGFTLLSTHWLNVTTGILYKYYRNSPLIYRHASVDSAMNLTPNLHAEHFGLHAVTSWGGVCVMVTTVCSLHFSAEQEQRACCWTSQQKTEMSTDLGGGGGGLYTTQQGVRGIKHVISWWLKIYLNTRTFSSIWRRLCFLPGLAQYCHQKCNAICLSTGALVRRTHTHATVYFIGE